MRSASERTWGLLTLALIIIVIGILAWTALFLSDFGERVGASFSAASTRTLGVPCSANLANVINSDSKSTPTTFLLGSCTYSANTTLRPQQGDEIAGIAGQVKSRPLRGTYPDGLTTKIVATGGLDVIIKPQGLFRMSWVDCSGANYTGSSGSGVCVAAGSMADTSEIRASYIHDNEGAGISNGRGTFVDVEATRNGSTASSGFIAAGLKCVNFCEVSSGWFHGNTGNGIWCDSGCDATSGSAHPNGFWVHNVEASENGGAGVRYENATTKALIEDSHIWGNSKLVNRAGITLRDAQNATVRNNIFAGAGYAHNQAPKNIAIRADSSGRVATKNISIVGNTLNGESIRYCGGPVTCSANN